MLTNQRTNGSFTWPESFTYDGANRILSSVQDSRTITYSYNIPSRMRTVTYPGGREITEYTDARTRMDHIDNNISTTPSIVQDSYDLANNMLTRNYPANGTTSSYTYNANNWTTSIAHNSPVTTPATFAGFNYTYDHEGNKQEEQKVHDTSHSECYGYDVTYRLTSFGQGTLGSPNPCPVVAPPTPTTQTSYSLDPVGNWNSKTTNGVTQTRTHSVNEITKINATTLTYDNDGDLTYDGTYYYFYDEEHRLTCVTPVAACQTFYGQYQYDALSRRVQKNADASGTLVTTLYFYDDARIIEEENTSFTTQATYVYGNYIDEILTMNRGGTDYYYHQNALWSVEAITNSGGNPVERYTYDAYGAPTITDGSFNPIAPNPWGTAHSAIGNPWMFTAREFDEETGLYYYRARYYDSRKGRFLQRDPLGYIAGMNLYEYVRSRPTFTTDPDGTFPGAFAGSLSLVSDILKKIDEVRREVPGLLRDLDDAQFLVRQRARERLQAYLNDPVKRAIAAQMLRNCLAGNPPLEVRQSLDQILLQYRQQEEREERERRRRQEWEQLAADLRTALVHRNIMALRQVESWYNTSQDPAEKRALLNLLRDVVNATDNVSPAAQSRAKELLEKLERR